ncbi:hypothetical protein HDU76_003149 [Blyttiomyces sp. JEL0837]|nr:hypothetical protein HDU76_003149 [Blyttiomyces sp. JEL0837]
MISLLNDSGLIISVVAMLFGAVIGYTGSRKLLRPNVLLRETSTIVCHPDASFSCESNEGKLSKEDSACSLTETVSIKDNDKQASFDEQDLLGNNTTDYDKKKDEQQGALSNLPAPIAKVFDVIDHTWETAVDFTASSITTFAIKPAVSLKKNCENVIDEVTSSVVDAIDRTWEKAVDLTASRIMTFAIKPTVSLKKNCENVIDKVTSYPVVDPTVSLKKNCENVIDKVTSPVVDVIDHTWEKAVDFTAWSVITFAIKPTVLLKNYCENVIDEVRLPVVELRELGDIVAEESACGCFEFVEGEGGGTRSCYCL